MVFTVKGVDDRDFHRLTDYVLQRLREHFTHPSYRFVLLGPYTGWTGSTGAVLVVTDSVPHDPAPGDVIVPGEIFFGEFEVPARREVDVIVSGKTRWFSKRDDGRDFVFHASADFTPCVMVPIPEVGLEPSHLCGWILSTIMTFDRQDTDDVLIPTPSRVLPGLTHEAPEGIVPERAYPGFPRWPL